MAADEIHKQPEGLASMAFQLRHIAGSIDRLLTYAEAGALSEKQMQALEDEKLPGGTPKGILAGT